MIWIQVLYFFFVTITLGYIVLDYLAYKTKSLYELLILSLGIGTSVYIVFSAVFDIFNIPIHWLVYLLLTISILAVYSIKRKERILKKLKKIDTKPSICDILVLALFIIHLGVFASASLAQPALENDDPWSVAINTDYISEQKTYDTSETQWSDGRSEPYAQGYHVIMGTLSQISGSVVNTLKFFNSLFVSISLLFMYIFVNKLFANKWIALASSFSLFANPSFLSRFIWAEALATSLLILLLYFLIQKEKSDLILAGFLWGCMALLHQRTFVVTTVIVMVYYLTIVITRAYQRYKANNTLLSLESIKTIFFNRVFFSGLIALAVFTLYWGYQIFKFGFAKIIGMTARTKIGEAYWSEAIINFSDYFITKSVNDMGNPAGIGVVIILVAFIGLLLWFTDKKIQLEHKIFFPLLLVTLIVLHQLGRFMPSPIAIITVWKFIAIPTALFFAYGLIKSKEIKIFNKRQGMYILAVLLVFSLVLADSAKPKYDVTTSTWPIGVMWVGGYETYKPYAYLQATDPDAKVFTTGRFSKIIGLDLNIDYTNQTHEQFKDEIYTKTSDEIYEFMTLNRYEYVIVDVQVIRDVGEEEGVRIINELLTKLSSDSRFPVIHNSQTAFLLRVN